ncbi:MAG: GAF domain-containing protein [Holophagales bacterium]|nr:GAF domain-containing protein [Holophagales bacterium]
MTSAPGISPDDETIPPRSGGMEPSGGDRAARACPLTVLLEASPDPALLTRANGTVVAANEAFATVWRRGDAGTCEGESLSTLFVAGAAELLEGVAGGQPFSCDGRAVLGDGTEVELRLSARRLRDPESSEERLVVFASDVTAARRLERAAAVLGVSLDTPGAGGFFDRLVEGLSRTLRMEMAIVGRLEVGDPGHVRTLAVWSGGAAAEPFTYDLHGAPCEHVVGRVPCVFPSRVAQLFPEDLLLVGTGLSSYVGVPLTSAGGSPLGLLAALSRRPLHDADSAARALGLFAGRAVAEIERREAREEERHREEESRRLVASIPVGLHRYLLEEDGRLVFAGANPAADTILGVDNRQFVGKTIETAFPGLVGTDVPDAYRRAASEGLPWRSESVTYSDGRVAGAFLVQAFQTGPREVVASFFDITARRRTEEALREREVRLERLNRILRTITHVQEILSEARETGELLGRVCSTLVADRDFVFAWVGLLDETGSEVGLAAASGPCDPARFRIDLKTLHGGPACGKAAFLRGAAVLVDESSGEIGCPECPTLSQHPEGSALALPLWKGERALGVLVVHAPHRGVFDAEESKLMEQLADGIAAAIDGIDAGTQRARAQRERAFRAGVASASFGEERPAGLLDALARSVAERFEAAGALVALWDENHGRLALARGCGVLEEAASSPELAEKSAVLLGRAGTPGSDESFVSRWNLGAETTAWPLRDGTHPLGILAIAPGRGGEPLAAGSDAAEQISLALSKARLFEVNSERVATLLALHDTGVDLGSNLERDVLLRAITDRAQGLVHGTMAGLYLMREDGKLALALANGVLANYVGAVLAPGEGVAGTVASTRKPILLDDYRAWPGRSPVFATAGIGSVIGVPVLWRGAVLGSLFVNHEVPGRFGAADVETVRLFAEQAAVAIANARLIGELKGAADELALAYDATLEGWVHALDLRDRETEGHTHRVVGRTVDLARRAGMAEETLVHVRRGALLHDIGKMGIPDRILQKPGALTEEEWAIMRLHPTYAHEMLGGIGFLRPALDIPCSHHEKWDGTGYPRGLRGEQISLAARVFAVVDIWDALVSDRPYRKAVPAPQVRDYLRTIAGTHLEPRLVELFLSTEPE